MLSPTNPALDTAIFAGLFALAILISLRPRKDNKIFPVSATQELKGFAILFIIFAHIGLVLSTDSAFLVPLSYLAGVGVNIFLLASGYGLTVSHMKKPLAPLQFYRKRLSKLFTPFWIVLGVYFLLDFFALGKTYALDYVVHSFLGFFETADAFIDVNSPLWYFTLILFYYLIYPLVVRKKFIWLSALGLFLINYYLIHYVNFVENIDNVGLYKYYTVAFPLGVFIAWALNQPQILKLFKKLKSKLNTSNLKTKLVYYGAIVVLPILFLYIRTLTGPYQEAVKEQSLNIISVLIVLIFFLVKRFEIKLFSLFGAFSFEIYLIHWPLMARYDILFAHLPGWLAVTLYLPVFLALAWLLQKLSNLPARRIR